jgi:predicted RNase H-like HicB family nuclease
MMQMAETTKTLEYYLNLPYPILLIPDPEDGTWYAKIPLLPGCMSDGETPEEAIANLREAQTLWLEVSLDEGDEIPEPEPVDTTLAN